MSHGIENWFSLADHGIWGRPFTMCTEALTKCIYIGGKLMIMNVCIGHSILFTYLYTVPLAVKTNQEAPSSAIIPRKRKGHGE